MCGHTCIYIHTPLIHPQVAHLRQSSLKRDACIKQCRHTYALILAKKDQEFGSKMHGGQACLDQVGSRGSSNVTLIKRYRQTLQTEPVCFYSHENSILMLKPLGRNVSTNKCLKYIRIKPIKPNFWFSDLMSKSLKMYSFSSLFYLFLYLFSAIAAIAGISLSPVTRVQSTVCTNKERPLHHMGITVRTISS